MGGGLLFKINRKSTLKPQPQFLSLELVVLWDHSEAQAGGPEFSLALCGGSFVLFLADESDKCNTTAFFFLLYNSGHLKQFEDLQKVYTCR